MQNNTGFKELLNSMMKRRWWITALVLGGFVVIIGAIFMAIFEQSAISGEWKELLLLLLGAFIGSYGKIIDYWFSDTDKDKMLVQKMDEEDGVSFSNTQDISSQPASNSNNVTPQVTPQVTIHDTDQVPTNHQSSTEQVNIDIFKEIVQESIKDDIEIEKNIDTTELSNEIILDEINNIEDINRNESMQNKRLTYSNRNAGNLRINRF